LLKGTLVETPVTIDYVTSVRKRPATSLL